MRIILTIDLDETQPRVREAVADLGGLESPADLVFAAVVNELDDLHIVAEVECSSSPDVVAAHCR